MEESQRDESVERKRGRNRGGGQRLHVVHILDLLVTPKVGVNDPESLERVVDVGDRDPAVLEEAARTHARTPHMHD